jgi:Zn-dependent protease
VSDKDPKVSFGQTVAALILTCAMFALALLAIFHLGLYPDWRLFAVAFLVSSVIGTVIHEGGHIVAALGFGRPIGEVRLGSGPVLVHFHLRGAIVRVGTWPFGGGKVWLRAGANLGKWEGVVFSASGIAVNTVAAALAFGFSSWSPTVLTAFFCANAFMAVANLVPIESEDGGPNDGTQILARLGILNPRTNAELARAISQKATVLKLEDLALELWTASADEALSVALRIAEASGAAQLGTEHLLAGVLADKETPGARTLTDMGFSGDRLLPLLDRGGATAPPTWTSEALTAVMFAIDAADPALGAGTGELCSGVLAATKGRGYAVLKEADITLGGFREELEPLRQPEIIVGCTRAMHFAWAIRATARLQAKRYADARADYLVMTPVAPDPHHRAVALNNAAWAALMVGDPAWRADALERAQQALAIEPDPPFIRGTLAYALVENGKPVEGLAALDSFDDAKTSPGGKASNLCVRAIAEARLGESEASARHLRDAQVLDPACELLDRARAELAVAPRA